MTIIILFKRSNNDFSDILSDKSIKKDTEVQSTFDKHLLLQTNEDHTLLSYIMLKYGNDIVYTHDIVPDRAPIIGKDYMPKTKI